MSGLFLLYVMITFVFQAPIWFFANKSPVVSNAFCLGYGVVMVIFCCISVVAWKVLGTPLNGVPL